MNGAADGDEARARAAPIGLGVAVYVERHGTPEHPRDLIHHRCIRWRWPGREQPYRWEFHEGERWFDVSVTGPLLVSSRDFAVEAAVGGMGIAFAVEQTVAGHVAAGRLMPLLETWSAPFPGFYLCYPAQRQMAPALRAFVDAVLESVRRLPS